MIFDPILNLFRGRAIAIPPYDGAFRPNNALETATVLSEIAGPDNLCRAGERILLSSRNELLQLDPTGATCTSLEAYPELITSLAISKTGKLALSLADHRLLIDGDDIQLPKEIRSITALAFDVDDRLYICNGSDVHSTTDWVVDLMEKRCNGSVWLLPSGSRQPTCLARNLAWPGGILVQQDRLVISESWRHRLVTLSKTGASPVPILDKLPGYPGRLTASRSGAAWLAIFAPRNRLVEFILQEDAYRHDMMREIPRQQWIAPSLMPTNSFLDPLQCGAIKTMGVRKPWAPSRSYGLAVYLDADLQPVSSYHSRADGRHHGVTSVSEIDERIWVAACGGNRLLDLGAVQELGAA
ncbi:hypothetical protein ACFPL7_00910 [Dongia soli]|uniref:Sugar lactone lactonase YvrE n=1 Tax=Dongia soli TaxID=600628 RepID=A0ABU5EEH9_9PROT|nr:hypothetical protein [Dongia soli]MDY0884332.1 hypothetical protein [Dongia soli]